MFLILTVCLFACAIGSAFACCEPAQWEGDMGLVIGTYSGDKPYFTEGMVKISVDTTNGLMAQVQNLYVDDAPFTQTIVIDEKRGLVNMVRDGACTRHRLSNPTPHCIPENATEGSVRYGLGGNAVNAKSYHVQYPGYEAYISVTADTCVPFSEVLFGNFNGTYMYETFMFTNVKAGIADSRVFLVPTSCELTPIGPPLPGVRRRALY